MPVQMLDWLVSVLAWLGTFSEPLGWVVLVLFVVGSALDRYDREYARPVVAVSWVLFGLFWLTLVHYFGIEQRSVIEGVGSALAVPLSLYVGHVLYRGRDSLFVLTRAIALMGIVYVPFVTIPVLRQTLIETVTAQTEFLMNLLGFQPEVVDGLLLEHQGETLRIAEKTHPYDSTFVFYGSDLPITYTILIACTGIGSMAIFAGLIGAVSAPLDRKARALAVSIPVIYVLNLVRNVFIGVTFGKQMTHVFPDLVMSLFSLRSEYMVSYIISDRIIAQSLSVVALVLITWLVIRELPEVLVVIEDVIYLLTGREYDLQNALNVAEPQPEGS